MRGIRQHHSVDTCVHCSLILTPQTHAQDVHTLSQMVNTVSGELDHCSKDALTGFIGWLLQGLLAGLAFTCLIGKPTDKFLLQIASLLLRTTHMN